MIRNFGVIFLAIFITTLVGCQSNSGEDKSDEKTAANSGPLRIITLAPGHFHAALVQKESYPDIDSNVYVYAPKGPELNAYLALIDQYNSRTDNPTHWNEIIYSETDYDKKAFTDKKGNLMVLSGNNRLKTQYILNGINADLNVLADKPMAINSADFDKLVQAFELAPQKGVLLYDIMTERSEITNILQKELINDKDLFGEFNVDAAGKPAINIESIHYYSKEVSGKPLMRPDWFFDPKQQGEAVADVGTHLVDIVQWQCFPNEVIDYKKDIEIKSAKIWPTPINLSQFKVLTGDDTFPDFLNPYITHDSVLQAHGNGEILYYLKGLPVKITVKWNYRAIKGGDSHYATYRGTKSNIEIRQGEAENFKPVVYITSTKRPDASFDSRVEEAIKKVSNNYPGVTAEKQNNGEWKVVIPQKYDVGHEAHFADVMNRYLQYIKDKKLPDWEVPNMIAKYYVTTKTMEIATEEKPGK